MKKEYRKPTVVSEEQLEQTSLGCNLHTEPPYGWGPACFPDSIPVIENYAKGGAWMDIHAACSNPVFEFSPFAGCGPALVGEGGPGGTGGNGILLS